MLREGLLASMEAETGARGRGAVLVHEESEVRRSLCAMYLSLGRVPDAVRVLEGGLGVDARLVIPYAMAQLPSILQSEGAVLEARELTMALIDEVVAELSSGRLAIAADPAASTAWFIDPGYAACALPVVVNGSR